MTPTRFTMTVDNQQIASSFELTGIAGEVEAPERCEATEAMTGAKLQSR